MRKIRIASQTIFLVLFLILFFETDSKGKDELDYPVKFFLELDPLILVTNVLANHTIIINLMIFSLITIVVTLIFGRVFCGWVCPLGTLNSIVGIKTIKRWRDWRRVKYYLLIFLLIASLLGLQLVGFLDPISLLIRSLAIGFDPSFNSSVRTFFDTIYHSNLPVITSISEFIYGFLKTTVLSFSQPSFRQELFIALLFIGILALNLVERRFWCNHLCPLGALLGFVGRFSLLQRFVSEDCLEKCLLCDRTCHGRTDPIKKEQWKAGECVYCFNCEAACKSNAVQFAFAGKRQGTALDLNRRRTMLAALSAVVAAPLLRFKKNPNPVLIRPPGAVPEDEFLNRCTKCAECMKVCITNGLQPTFLEAGIEGMWTPILVPKIGYCEYRCTLCGQVCPTGAIKRLDTEEKAKVKIGLAFINQNRCLPYANAVSCIVCEEVCPTPQKAIWFDEVEVRTQNGSLKRIKLPKVNLQLCIGCGICETKCPVADMPAIYVTSIGETRSKENQLLL